MYISEEFIIEIDTRKLAKYSGVGGAIGAIAGGLKGVYNGVKRKIDEEERVDHWEAKLHNSNNDKAK